MEFTPQDGQDRQHEKREREEVKAHRIGEKKMCGQKRGKEERRAKQKDGRKYVN